MDHFKNFPEEMTLEILSRVPIESVKKCKLVCQSWNNFVSHHPFSKMHLQHVNRSFADSGKLSFIARTKNKYDKFYYFEYNEDHESTPIGRIGRIHFILPFRYATYVGSCNGFICFSDFHSSDICICNPITKEYIVLPRIKTDCLGSDKSTCWTRGFGYVSSTDEYKVVGIRMSMNPQFVEVYVYTLGSGNGWRNLGKFNLECDGGWEESVFVNGALHWLDYELGILFTFDLAEEKFGEHLPPPLLPPGSDQVYDRIGVLNGVLFYAVGPVDQGGQLSEGELIDIWLLKKKNDKHGMKEGQEHQSLGWSKEFEVDEGELLAVTKSGGVLSYIGNYIYIDDTKASTSERLVDLLVDFQESFDEVFPHKNTLLSLKELGEEDTKVMESARKYSFCRRSWRSRIPN